MVNAYLQGQQCSLIPFSHEKEQSLKISPKGLFVIGSEDCLGQRIDIDDDNGRSWGSVSLCIF